ncbi:ABC transporter permease subunit [Planomicrobium sp. CPCC 101079]|uniref:ABC transporter permease subunit n=1 Tax=Planomicrobium sp. CPCC 101079 TaxID=2599618 RepID=UPI0011B511D9|nr:ABC transporter permease subunit [Planomicrobium sp. CPCC 101079]TWT01905.1 ABC transporter permease subunit [Planomicrobium sp. CPCC 101079]
MWTISKLTFKEIVSKRIFMITIVMTLIFLALYGTAIYFAGKEGAEVGDGGQGTEAILLQQFVSSQLLGVGLYFSSFITALLAILSSVSTISGEVSSHQIDTWLMRPISRSQFVLGKFMGLAFLMIAYAVCLFFSIILLHQGIGTDWMALNLQPMQLIKAVSVFAIQPFVLIAFGLLLSTRMTTLNAGIVSIMLYGAAFIGGFIEQFGALVEKTSLVNIGIIMSLVFPIDSMYRKMTILLFDTADNPLSLAQGGMFTSISTPGNVMVWYAVLYGVVAVILAIYSFKNRDV